MVYISIIISETDVLSKTLRQAGNTPGSVTTSDFAGEISREPYKRAKVWEKTIFALIDEHHEDTGKSTIAICDLGCGAGALTAAMVGHAKNWGYEVDVTILDLMPKNILATKLELEKLEVAPSKNILGDVLKNFPDDKYDFMSAFELIHWLTPEGVDTFFSNAREHLNRGGWLFISFATEINNALLRNEKNVLDIKRSRQKRPIHTFSYATNTWMTFFDQQSITNLGKRHGFQARYHFGLDNMDFPTRTVLGLPRTTGPEISSSENAFIAFRAE